MMGMLFFVTKKEVGFLVGVARHSKCSGNFGHPDRANCSFGSSLMACKKT